MRTARFLEKRCVQRNRGEAVDDALGGYDIVDPNLHTLRGIDAGTGGGDASMTRHRDENESGHQGVVADTAFTQRQPCW